VEITILSTAQVTTILAGPLGTYLIVLLIIVLMVKELLVNLETEWRTVRRVLNVGIVFFLVAFLGVVAVRTSQFL
jgi:hypothetical protein